MNIEKISHDSTSKQAHHKVSVTYSPEREESLPSDRTFRTEESNLWMNLLKIQSFEEAALSARAHQF